MNSDEFPSLIHFSCLNPSKSSKVGDLMEDSVATGNKRNLDVADDGAGPHKKQRADDEGDAGANWNIIGGLLGVARNGVPYGLPPADVIVHWADTGECAYETLKFLQEKVPNLGSVTPEYFIKNIPVDTELTVTMKVKGLMKEYDGTVVEVKGKIHVVVYEDGDVYNHDLWGLDGEDDVSVMEWEVKA